jgi:hypothetical protein
MGERTEIYLKNDNIYFLRGSYSNVGGHETQNKKMKKQTRK